jgi:hypothetical protein
MKGERRRQGDEREHEEQLGAAYKSGLKVIHVCLSRELGAFRVFHRRLWWRGNPLIDNRIMRHQEILGTTGGGGALAACSVIQ